MPSSCHGKLCWQTQFCLKQRASTGSRRNLVPWCSSNKGGVVDPKTSRSPNSVDDVCIRLAMFRYCTFEWKGRIVFWKPLKICYSKMLRRWIIWPFIPLQMTRVRGKRDGQIKSKISHSSGARQAIATKPDTLIEEVCTIFPLEYVFGSNR